jgi:predicted dehydrogenase
MKYIPTSELITHPHPDTDYVVAVQDIFLQQDVADQYFQPDRDIRIVLGYIRRLGFWLAVRKIISRLSESNRNKKIAAIGLGRVLQSPTRGELKLGQEVIFAAYNHFPGGKIITLHRDFVFSLCEAVESCEALPNLCAGQIFALFAGWSPFSGRFVDRNNIGKTILPLVRASLESGRTIHGSSPQDRFTSRIEPYPPKGTNERLRAVIFGLGNYAKSHLVPIVRKRLTLACVHELDPQQALTALGWGCDIDTSPEPRKGEKYDYWFIAGYHNTHTGLAVEAIARGGCAVVEKPLATSFEQLERLRSVLTANPAARLCPGFHRRYSRMNDWALKDLGQVEGGPIDYHCLVYEVPLPSLHWYGWESSGSCLISNGCHWIDHFLFLNKGVAILSHSAFRSSSGCVSVYLEASNGATFSMQLTSNGSPRLGVRDYIELRVKDKTVKMCDQSLYLAENRQRIVRKRKVRPQDAYSRMYHSILDNSFDKQGSIENLLYSTQVTLELEKKLLEC